MPDARVAETIEEFIDSITLTHSSHCIIEPVDGIREVNGIFLPDDMDNRKPYGYVLKKAKDCISDEIDEGDCVIFEREKAKHLHFKDATVCLVDIKNIQAVII